MEVITTHVNTDFDAFASLLAARRLYPGAVVALPGSLNKNVREFYRLHADELDVADAGALDLDAIERLILVETVHPGRLGEFEAVARREDVDVVAFDHHQPDRPAWLASENVVVADDAALTTTLVGILAERELEVTPLEATVFALGIHEDTGSLTYPGVTQRDADALAWCLRHGARQEMIAQYLHSPLAERERSLLDALVDGLEAHDAGGFEVLLTAVSWPEYVDGVSNLAHKIVDLTDARGLVCLVEMEARVFCVVRARVAELDASAIARALGGGGHAQAASAVFRGPLADARSRSLSALASAVRRRLTAADVMSRPPRFVSPDDTVAHAMVLCQQHRQSGIQVGHETWLAGIVTREDLDRAVGHGLSHAPVKSVMHSDVITCAEETPLAELQRLVSTTDVGRIPVVRGGEVVGVVTRSDVLRALEEPVREEAASAALDLGDRLRELAHLERVFEAVQAVGEQFEGVYLVGGAVRDVLMGEPNFDVDIAVEGDGITFARALATVLGARVVPHEKFATAVVKYDGGRVDVATTRTEFYDSPAALPRVEHASIRQDLFRRDFTINAMAVSLKGDDFGRLVDYFGGVRDLESGTVRVLHNLSFIDDPTRIFRAIRYENRHGFRMDAHTLALARACVEMNLVGELSSARLRDELQALLSEDAVGDSILRLRELGIDRSIHPHLAADDEAVRLAEEVDRLRSRYAPEAPAWRSRLAVLARRLSPDELYDWFDKLKLRRRDADRVADAVTVAPRLDRLLAEVEEPAEIRGIVEPHDPDGALLALATAAPPARARLERYFEELRDVRLEISGSDLAELGVAESPRVGFILHELLRRKLNHELDGRAAELEAAKELLHDEFPASRRSRE
ncbi:MAG: CBS domain-containing protein [Actinomycetota bacterium]|nr:CBS domain-containing protein [Actinomycetota bacterium]